MKKYAELFCWAMLGAGFVFTFILMCVIDSRSIFWIIYFGILGAAFIAVFWPRERSKGERKFQHFDLRDLFFDDEEDDDGADL